MGISIDETVPDFELRDTEGVVRSLRDGDATATVVVFTCNHCPYALAWHDRLIAVARAYADRRVRFLAINSNDAERYPADSYEQMQQRVATEGWPHPYLHDETQKVAREWGAKVTPDVFVLDAKGRLCYRGAPDSDYSDPSQDAAWLRSALEAVLAGEQPSEPETEPVGCSIKWKK